MMYIHCGKFHHFSYTQSKFIEGGGRNPPPPPALRSPKKPSLNRVKRSHISNEMEKKRHYRVLQVEHGSFSPLVFTVNGGMGNECKASYSRLA